MEKPKEFFVLYKDSKNELKQFDTNYENSALSMATKKNGVVYIDTRYKAKKRLYWYLWRKKEYGD